MAQTPFLPDVIPDPRARAGVQDSTGREFGLSCQARPRDDGLVELVVLGALPPDWSLRLTAGLARRGVSLVEGHAMNLDGRRWRARLRLDPGTEPLPDVASLLVGDFEFGFRPDPRLLDFSLETGVEPLGEVLRLEVHAWDAVGLLAGVLTRVAVSGLDVAELVLDTDGGLAFHQLTLVPARDGLPVADLRRPLARRLAMLTVS